MYLFRQGGIRGIYDFGGCDGGAWGLRGYRVSEWEKRGLKFNETETEGKKERLK